MNTIAVVGRATLADALFALGARRGCEVLAWTPHEEPSSSPLPEHVRPVAREELAQTPLIFVCVPIDQVRDVGRQLGDAISARHILVHACRELEPKTLMTASGLLKQETPTHRFGFLTGPIRADDLAQGNLGAGSIASPLSEVQEAVAETLVSTTFRLYRGRDLRGAELASAYTRAIAFVMGLAEAMQQGPSVKATIYARGLAEASRFAAFHGGQAQTAFGMSGSGNLFADIQAPGSLAFRLGLMTMERGRFEPEDLAQALEPPLRPALAPFMRLIQTLRQGTSSNKLSSNIFDATHSVIVEGKPPLEAATYLMSLPVMLDE